jgi:hypothetical protein
MVTYTTRDARGEGEEGGGGGFGSEGGGGGQPKDTPSCKEKHGRVSADLKEEKEESAANRKERPFVNNTCEITRWVC